MAGETVKLLLLRRLLLRLKLQVSERWQRARLRHCERSEAIQTVSAEGFWIASLRSQ